MTPQVQPDMNESRSWIPRFNPWLVAIAVMLPTFMEVLDTAVANVSLPHIAGSLSSTLDETTWVLTSYLVSNAVILPASAWLTGFLGRRRLLMACIALFTVASAACGTAPTLATLIAARVFQGIGGGALQPVSQAVLLESFPRRQLGMAMALFGLGVVSAPIVGPIVGGWITDNYSWRWVFYINLPIGLLSILLVHYLVEDPPYVRRRGFHVDYIGFGLMAVGLSALQILLDRGQREQWLASALIRWLAVVAATSLVAFIIHEMRDREPVVRFRVFRDRNFATGTLLIAVIGAVIYGTATLLPLMLQGLMGYTAVKSGVAVSPRGIGSLIGMLIAAPMIWWIDNRILIITGFSLLAWSSWLLARLTLQSSMSDVQWPCLINGLSLGLLFVPLAALAVGRLRQEDMGNATSLFNVMRNIGGSVGVSIVTTMQARAAQVHQVWLTANLTPFNLALSERVDRVQAHLGPLAHSHVVTSIMYHALYGLVVRNANFMGFLDDYRMLTLLVICCLPLTFCFARSKGRPVLHLE